MGLYLLIPTFVVILLSIMIVRAGAIALRMTGVDQKTANFQALSAFTRAGFTTRESEAVVSHPQRRAIVSWLIILGNAGIVAVIVTGTSSLASSTDYRLAINIAILAVGIYIIYRLIRHTELIRRWENLVENRLLRGEFFKRIPVEHLLQLAGGYGVGRVPVIEEPPFTDAGLKDKLAAGGFVILGIERQGQWIPNPGAKESFIERDSLIVYGVLSKMEKVFQNREAG
jgi:hypothetical protein